MEWECLTELRDILRAFRGSTIKRQASLYATINQTIPCVMKLLDALEIKKSEELEKKNLYLAMGITMAHSKILDYFPVYDDNIEKMKNLYLATALDPRYKLKFLREVKFSNERIMEIEGYFHKVFDRYSEEAEDDVTEVTPKKRKREVIESIDSDENEDDYYLESDEETVEHEIDNYLKQGRVPRESPIQYFRDRKATFTVISRIARNFLASSAMSAPAESLFPRVGDIVSKKRNRLSPTTVKILAFLKSHGKITDEMNFVDDMSKLKLGDNSVSEGVGVSGRNTSDAVDPQL